MSLVSGDLTTPQQFSIWLGSDAPTLPSPAINQLVSSVSSLILSKLSRARLYSQTFVRVFDGVGVPQIVLPDWPVTGITAVQVGCALIPIANLPAPVPNFGLPTSTFGYGIRWVPWSGNLPGDPAVLQFLGGSFIPGYQNVRITYTAGYSIPAEPHTVPSVTPYTVIVDQPQGIWCRDGGVTYASSGIALVPVTASPTIGQYIPPPAGTALTDVSGQYTFSAADAGMALLFNYSFIPADLMEAANQMIAERQSYKSRIGVISQSLGGQETIRYMRGGAKAGMFPDLPPEVESLIWPYVSVIPPAIGTAV